MKSICIFSLIIFTLLLTGCEEKSNSNITDSQNNMQDSSLYGVNRLNSDENGTASRSINSTSGENSGIKEFTNVDSKLDITEDEHVQFDDQNNMLEENPTFLSTYSTKILTDDENRYNNIKIVSDRLNNYVLEPGKEFSFNEVCGPYGKEDGFLEATILLSNGKEDEGYGGGVCQLSSTLYNAVKALDLEITEHHHHSSPVAYVPKNQDATVSLQSNLDFKFKNSYNYSIKFRTVYDPNNLTVFIDKA